ncbi:MAG: hypothetical protein ABI743_04445 [bacterium]
MDESLQTAPRGALREWYDRHYAPAGRAVESFAGLRRWLFVEAWILFILGLGLLFLLAAVNGSRAPGPVLLFTLFPALSVTFVVSHWRNWKNDEHLRLLEAGLRELCGFRLDPATRGVTDCPTCHPGEWLCGGLTWFFPRQSGGHGRNLQLICASRWWRPRVVALDVALQLTDFLGRESALAGAIASELARIPVDMRAQSPMQNLAILLALNKHLASHGIDCATRIDGRWVMLRFTLPSALPWRLPVSWELLERIMGVLGICDALVPATGSAADPVTASDGLRRAPSPA